MNASSFFGYGIIGTSDGFAAQTAGLLADIDIGRIVDLDNRQIFAPFDTEIIAGIREKRDGHLYTYFVLYRYAVEQERSRLGSFYGSVVALKDCTSDGYAIYNLLLELATNVKVYLDPETRRFLVPLEEVTFLQPDSMDEVIRSIKKQSISSVIPTGYFAPLPAHSRNSFRFIDFFQHQDDTVERFFVSQDKEVLGVVKNKTGLSLKKLRLENALIEKKLQQVEAIDSEIVIREKELNRLIEQQQEASTQLALLEKQQLEWTAKLQELNPQLQELAQNKTSIEEEISVLHKTKEELLQHNESLKIKPPPNSEPEETEHEKVEDKTDSSKSNFALKEAIQLIKNLHPITKMIVLILAFVSLGTLGYQTTKGFAKKSEKLSKAEAVPPISEDLAKLEKQISEEYQAFEKPKQDSFLARLTPFLSSDNGKVKEKARQIQKNILTVGYQYYSKELERTDTIPVLHGQLVEEFEMLKNEYDSVFVSLKQ